MLGVHSVVAVSAEEWSPPTHVPSESPTRWTVLLPDDSLQTHAFWAAGNTDGPLDPYVAEYHAIMYSDSPNGVDWSDGIDILFDPNKIDAMVATYTEGIHHVIWNSECVHIASASADGNLADGKVWMNSVNCVAPKAIPEGIAVSTNPEGNLYLAYSTGDQLFIQRSEDNGGSWSVPVSVASAVESGGASTIAYPKISTTDEGHLYAVWAAIGSAAEEFPNLGIFFSRSLDGIENWTLPIQLAGEFNSQPALASIGQDEVHVVWNTRVGISKRLHRWSSDGGVTWSPESAIVDAGIAGATAGLQGSPAILIDDRDILTVLVGTNDGVRFREWENEEWDETTSIGSRGDGETWVTGLVNVGSSRTCAYWSGMAAPSPGFSITCRGDLAVVDNDSNRSVGEDDSVNDAQAPLPDNVGLTQGGQEANIEPDNTLQVTEAPATTSLAHPANGGLSNVQALFLSAGMTLGVIVVLSLIQVQRTGRRR